jgi:hypothetical protein
MPQDDTIFLFQSAKLGEPSHLLTELEQARRLAQQDGSVRRIYGVSGGAFAALGFALAIAAQREPAEWHRAGQALEDFSAYLSSARNHQIRSLNRNPWYGLFRLTPLRHWLAERLRFYTGRDDIWISEIPAPLYICVMDQDAILIPYGAPDKDRQFQYQFVRVGPPEDAPVVDAVEAALSTMLSTSPVRVRGIGGATAVRRLWMPAPSSLTWRK